MKNYTPFNNLLNKKIFFYLILLLTFISSCKRQNNSNDTVQNKKDTTKLTTVQKLEFNVFIENSGSMDGYISQPSEFKNVLRNLITDIPTHFGDDSKKYFINSKKYCQVDIENSPNFILNLSSNNYRINCDPGNTSTIDKIIDQVTTNIKNKVNILFSDCILSYNNSQIDGAKSAQQNIKKVISKKVTNENISTLVLKFNSKYKGYYYSETTGRGIEITKIINRPYYALIFGEANSIAQLLSKIDFNKYEGFESSFTLVAKNGLSNPQSRVIYKNKIGTYEYAKPATLLKIIKAEPNKQSNKFQFSINTNLKNYPFLNDFITENSQYKINGNFNIQTIQEDKSDQDYTHLISMGTDDLQQISNVSVGIKYSIPEWIIKSSNDIDSNPIDSLQQRQTFGLKYLMTGLSEAYIAANNDSVQFNIPITIYKPGSSDSKNSSKLIWWILLFVTILISITIYLKNKK